MSRGLQDGVETPEGFMTATDARQPLFDFLALPAELRRIIYKYADQNIFTRRQHANLPPETTDEFKIRIPILFLNKQITAEFLHGTQDVNPITGRRDRLDGTAPIEYYTCTDWGRHAQTWENFKYEDIPDFLEHPSVQDIMRVEIFIDIDQMLDEVKMYHLEDINSHFSSDSISEHNAYDEIHITYADREKETVGIQHAEYTIIKDTKKGVYKTTFVRKIADEVGDVEEITEVTEAPGWSVNEHLPEEEYERVITRAEVERLRYFNYESEEWYDALGPLEKREEEEVKSGPWRPGNVETRDPWHDDEWDELEMEDEGGLTLLDIAGMFGESS